MIKPESTGRMAEHHRGDFGGAVADLGGPAAVQRLASGGVPVTTPHRIAKAGKTGKARPAEIERHRNQGVAARRAGGGESRAEQVLADGFCQRDVIRQQMVDLVIGQAAVGQVTPDTDGQPAGGVGIGKGAPPLMPGQQPDKITTPAITPFSALITALRHGVSASFSAPLIWPVLSGGRRALREARSHFRYH